MDNKRNVILAVLLAGLILIGWPIVMEAFFPGMSQKNEQVEAKGDPATDQQGKPVAGASADPQAIDAVAAGPVREAAQIIGESPRIPIVSDHVRGSINLRGGKIDDLVLPKYRQTLDKDSPPVRLFSPSGTEQPYFGRFGWAGQSVEVPGSDTVWQADGEMLTPATPVTLTTRNGSGQTFAIRLSIDDDYMITAEQSVTNNSGDAVAVMPYALVSRVRDEDKVLPEDQDQWTIHSGPVGVFDGAAEFDWNYDDVEEAGAKGVEFGGDIGWIGFTDKYWLAALIPGNSDAVEARLRSGAGNLYQAEISSDAFRIVPAGKKLTTTNRLFAGAKENDLLEAYESAGVTQFDRAIDWGWFYWFEKPIFYLLAALFKYVGNFGLAIILLTVIVRLILFPIAQKQFASMAQMRAVQPKMKKLQERHKDDKQKLQQEMMKLYKDEGVNPLAGCLPIFLQIPIFFALYKVLMLSIEMRHQPFILWIKDLSAPDPLTPVNLFGLLAFDPPVFLAIGILPILMGITMWMQFRLNPAPMDPIQQQMFAIMPWVLMFIMAPFAAGLQLYWTVSNLLTIAQQKWLYSRHPQMKEAMANEKAEKAKEAEKAGA